MGMNVKLKSGVEWQVKPGPAYITSKLRTYLEVNLNVQVAFQTMRLDRCEVGILGTHFVFPENTRTTLV